jgi:hypothetical protein
VGYAGNYRLDPAAAMPPAQKACVVPTPWGELDEFYVADTTFGGITDMNRASYTGAKLSCDTVASQGITVYYDPTV